MTAAWSRACAAACTRAETLARRARGSIGRGGILPAGQKFTRWTASAAASSSPGRGVLVRGASGGAAAGLPPPRRLPGGLRRAPGPCVLPPAPVPRDRAGAGHPAQRRPGPWVRVHGSTARRRAPGGRPGRERPGDPQRPARVVRDADDAAGALRRRRGPREGGERPPARPAGLGPEGGPAEPRVPPADGRPPPPRLPRGAPGRVQFRGAPEAPPLRCEPAPPSEFSDFGCELLAAGQPEDRRVCGAPWVDAQDLLSDGSEHSEFYRLVERELARLPEPAAPALPESEPSLDALPVHASPRGPQIIEPTPAALQEPEEPAPPQPPRRAAPTASRQTSRSRSSWRAGPCPTAPGPGAVRGQRRVQRRGLRQLRLAPGPDRRGRGVCGPGRGGPAGVRRRGPAGAAHGQRVRVAVCGGLAGVNSGEPFY